MTRWKNSAQKKELEEMLARDLINTDISKMSKLEYKTTIVRLLKGIEDTRESLTVEIKRAKI